MVFKIVVIFTLDKKKQIYGLKEKLWLKKNPGLHLKTFYVEN